MSTAGRFFVRGVLAAALFATASAQAGRTANEGVYAEDQAAKGEQVYYTQCANCHGDSLEGMGPAPALAGAAFLANWESRTVGELFEKNHLTMPATAPGTLTAEEAAEVTAFLLYACGFPWGQAALATQAEPLRQIRIGRPAP